MSASVQENGLLQERLERLPETFEVKENDEQRELREALAFQAENHSKRWDAFISPIVDRDFDSEALEVDLGWFTDRLQNTKSESDGLERGGWRRMMVDMANDKTIGDYIDGYNKMGVLGHVQDRTIYLISSF